MGEAQEFIFQIRPVALPELRFQGFIPPELFFQKRDLVSPRAQRR